ncbi:MAG: type II toxin-antitoxin system YafQ family toxin [Pantoea sp.]|uniref:type II toxin-antitoxin system YafQ family toxin n=1 Tax=Pantoea septica TaxID=472695 RepID=UPI000E931969|nr:type II toxin-antitoxin system YafQ family toxin [Pantoea septica]MBU5376325.1 type II toxin-antitoxin system YafQ family toxin [Pantoea septica]MDU5839286.1 type II toxin-antitoxin system YafQ family toxin [Pantoea sp.]MDU6441060.1 type II toxin-antitoxin system YafQ family toxin [Pantoea sp.]HAT24309.1 type II toxin-antitoxin system mRNA interferase toxin, RelE/StbE family [Pantoea septica]
MAKQKEIAYSSQFYKDVKKMQKRRKEMSRLKTLMSLLINNRLPLPAAYRDHPLQGNYNGYRDAHIEPDWLLIYKITDELVRFERTGTHGDLF